MAGQRVAVVDVGSLLSIATMLGAARIGAAAALMNPALTPPELRGCSKNAGCADVGGRGGGVRRPTPRSRCAPRYLTATDLVEQRPGRRAADAADDVDDRDALILFTSGTTGLPKAIGITQRQLDARIKGRRRTISGGCGSRR